MENQPVQNRARIALSKFRELGVRYVLEGSVRKAGDELRITAQLIEIATDSHLWSQTYDRRLENVFAVQNDIAAAVARELVRIVPLVLSAHERARLIEGSLPRPGTDEILVGDMRHRDRLCHHVPEIPDVVAAVDPSAAQHGAVPFFMKPCVSQRNREREVIEDGNACIAHPWMLRRDSTEHRMRRLVEAGRDSEGLLHPRGPGTVSEVVGRLDEGNVDDRLPGRRLRRQASGCDRQGEQGAEDEGLGLDEVVHSPGGCRGGELLAPNYVNARASGDQEAVSEL